MIKLDLRLVLTSLAISAVAAACTGGSSGPSSLPTSQIPANGGLAPSATSAQPPNAQRRWAQIRLDNTGQSIRLPSIPGMRESITLPRNDAPPGAVLEVRVSRALPSIIARLPARKSRAFVSFTLRASVGVRMHDVPKFSVQMTTKPASNGAYYAWGFSAQTGWRDLGPMTVSGSVLNFGGRPNFKLSANVLYTVTAFTARQGAVPPPNPVTCAPQITGPGPLPGGTKLYVLDEEYPNGFPGPSCGYVRVFDETGKSIVTQGGFPGLGDVFSGAFDPLDQHLYIASTAGIKVYDLNGNPVATTGDFPNAGSVVAFDTFKGLLYTVGPGGTVHRFTREGQPSAMCGFAKVTNPIAMTFSPDTHAFYVIQGNSPSHNEVFVYREDGTQNPFTIGKFQNLTLALGITYDPFNKQLYVTTNADTGTPPFVRTYDELGNEIAVTGEFGGIGTSLPTGIAFDTSNRNLYMGFSEQIYQSSSSNYIFSGGLIAYDESGNEVGGGGANLQLTVSVIAAP